MKKIVLTIFLLLMSLPAQAKLHSETVTYKQGETTLEGYLVQDEKYLFSKGFFPAVIVVHDWMGLGDYAKKRADMLAELGYIAFAVDIYGKGVRPKNSDEASQQATYYKNNRALLRARANAGYEYLKKYANVDKSRIAAMGYCFGGTTVLEMARSGTNLAGVVTFHGGLSTPKPEDAKNIKAKVLVLHGVDDPFVKADEVKAFQKEMNDAKVDWQMVYYSGAVHAFTRADVGTDNSKGVAYNEKADKRSWEAMKQFFNEVFSK